jgi:DNA-binding IscR family transcriptional regulator
MALLKDKGYVRSEKDHWGGWTLAKPQADMTLLDIHQALGSSSLFAIGMSTDHPQCLVEQAVNAAQTDAFDAAQALLINRLASVTLEQLASDFRTAISGSLNLCDLQTGVSMRLAERPASVRFWPILLKK